MQGLTRVELDKARCQVPGCNHRHHGAGLAIHGRCHPTARMEVWYADGLLTFHCGRCLQVVTVIAVAEKPTVQ